MTSAPAGINCGIDCTENYAKDTVVTLIATPSTGSSFSAWSGDPDCTDGSVSMTTARNCTATFTLVDVPGGAQEKILFEVGNNIYVMDSDGTNQKKLTNETNTDLHCRPNPSWSPNGLKILFKACPDAGIKEDIYVMNADGSNLQKLTENFVYEDTIPSWSPDGAKIAFASPSLVRDVELHLMNSDGSNQKKLATIGFDADFSWSPDGTKIVFTTPSDVFVMNADGTIFKNLTNDLDFSDANREPSWSPDGTKIIFVRKNRRLLQSLGVYVMNVNGSNKQKLTDLAGT